MRLGIRELIGGRVAPDHAGEPASEGDGELAIAAPRIPRERVLDAVLGEDIDERGGVVRPELRVLLRDAAEVVLGGQGYRPWKPMPPSKDADSQRASSSVSAT